MKIITSLVFVCAIGLITVAAYIIGINLSPTSRFFIYYTAGSLSTLIGLLIIEFTR